MNALGSRESTRVDSDDGDGDGVDGDDFADDVGRATKTAPPEAITDDGYGSGGGGAVVGGQDGTTDRRGHLHLLVEVAGDEFKCKAQS